MSTQRKRGTNVHDMDMELLAELEETSSDDDENVDEEEETTQTATLYKELMKDRKFLFTF